MSLSSAANWLNSLLPVPASVPDPSPRPSPESMRQRCESDKESLHLFRQIVASTAKTYFSSHPGPDSMPCNTALHDAAHKLLTSEAMSYTDIKNVLLALESRLSMMDLADQFLSLLSLTHPAITCRTLDLQLWEREHGHEYQQYRDIRAMILRADFFPPSALALQGSRFLKPQGYLAAVLSVSGRDQEGAVADLGILQAFAHSQVQGALTVFESSPEVD